MPEHTPDTFDLDQAFRSLSTEVGERTASRGASAAIGTARRRRTTIAAVAAAALLAVGGVMTAQLGNSEDRLVPTGEVPPPAALDATALNGITAGWVSGWHEAGKDDEATLAKSDKLFTCLNSIDDTSGSEIMPNRMGTQLMVGDSGAIAYFTYADFDGLGDQVDVGTQGFSTAFATCAGNSGETDSYGDRASVTSYDLPVAGSATSVTAWVARLGDRLSFAMILAPGRQTAGQRTVIGAALLAAVQVDDSYRDSDALQIDGGSATASAAPSQASEPPAAHPGIVDSDLAAALDGWSSWADRGDSTSAQLPCLTTSPQGSSSGSGLSVGTTGELATYDFETSDAAARGMQQLLVALIACDNGPWDVDSTTVPGVVVASHPDGVVWVAQQGPTMAVFTLADATDPPDRVKLAVGKLVIDSLS